MTHHRRIVIFIAVCSIVYISGCIGEKRHELKKIMSVPINIPQCFLQKDNGGDENVGVIINSYKTLFFIDSIHCVTCNLKQIAFLHQAIQEDYHIPLWVIVASRKKDFLEVQHYVKSLDPSIMVFVDTCNVFWKGNPQIPQEQSMHIFLLDSCNNVLVVGDPTRGKVKELYKKVLQNDWK